MIIRIFLFFLMLYIFGFMCSRSLAFRCPYPYWTNEIYIYDQSFDCGGSLRVEATELISYTEITDPYGFSFCRDWRSLGFSHFLYDDDWRWSSYCIFKKNHDPANVAFVKPGIDSSIISKVVAKINNMPCWSSFSVGSTLYAKLANRSYENPGGSNALYRWVSQAHQSFCGSIINERYHIRYYLIGYNYTLGYTIVLGFVHHDVRVGANHIVDCIECAENKLANDCINFGQFNFIDEDSFCVGNVALDSNGCLTIIYLNDE